MKKVAVVLCGSGFKDGSEIRESVATLWALSQLPVEVQCFAPDAPQLEVVNSLTGETAKGETRNMLVESARIARGNVKALSELNPDDWDAMIMPGGFGAAKNLCDFAFKGSQGKVNPEIQKVISNFHLQDKPIGAICIAPAILALALKGEELELTVGEPSEASQEIEKLGHKHVVTEVTDCYVDFKSKIISTAAYMYDDASLHDIFTGIQRLVNATLAMA